VCLSHIVDEDGKMSKSLGNIVKPFDVFDAVGPTTAVAFCRPVAPDMQKRVSVDIVSGGGQQLHQHVLTRTHSS